MRIVAHLLPALILLLAAHAAEPPAATPPMGWNSWDSYGTTVTEDEVLADRKSTRLNSSH